MKVKYTGGKSKISFHTPIGCKSKGSIANIYFLKPGEEVDISEVDARALVACDKNFALSESEKPASKKLSNVPKEVQG